MSLALRQKQSAFLLRVGRLLAHAEWLGYELTLGEAYRSPEEAARLARLGKGILNSLHGKRLAIDLHLFIDGIYQTSSEAHRPLGEWWEQQSTPDLRCCWGGRFARPDGNHYSVEHEGVR